MNRQETNEDTGESEGGQRGNTEDVELLNSSFGSFSAALPGARAEFPNRRIGFASAVGIPGPLLTHRDLEPWQSQSTSVSDGEPSGSSSENE